MCSPGPSYPFGPKDVVVIPKMSLFCKTVGSQVQVVLIVLGHHGNFQDVPVLEIVRSQVQSVLFVLRISCESQSMA